jgi:hypothetical protein
MTKIQIRKMVGLGNDDPWPRKLTFTLHGTPFYTLLELEQCESYLRSLGYVNTAVTRRPNGASDFVFVRQLTDKEDPEELIRDCRRALKEEMDWDHDRDDFAGQLIVRLNKFLGDEG